MKVFANILVFLLMSTPLTWSANWPSSRGNQQLTGVVSERIPLSVQLKWSVPLGKELKASPVVYNQKIVIGSTDGTLYCLDFAGKILWSFKTDNAIEASALILNNTVYVGNLSGHLFAVDLTTGRQKWKYTANNQFMAACNYWTDGTKTYILAGNYDYFLHCLDAKTGKLIWKYEAENYLNAAVSVENSMAVFGGCDGELHVVNVLTGKELFAKSIASYVASSATIENGLAYVGDYDGKVTCFNLVQKKNKWIFDDPDKDIPFVGALAVLGNRVFIGCKDRFLYCLNKGTGQLLWKKNLGNPIEASPLLDAKNVLIANMRGELFLLNQLDGTKLWMYDMGGPMIGSPALSNQHLFVSSVNGKLSCLIKK